MLTLQAKVRKILGKKVKKLRKENLIPGVVYGHNLKTRAIEVDYKAFNRVFKEAGESSLLSLEIDQEKPVSVLAHDLSYDPLTSKIIHVDFYQVKVHEKLTTEVELEFTGEAPAVKNLGGILVTHLKSVKIECLPGDLIHQIEVDLSLLNNYGDEIKIKDLKVPEKIKILEEPEIIVVNVEEPRKEEEVVKEEVEVKEEAPITQTEAPVAGEGGVSQGKEKVQKTEEKKPSAEGKK